MASEARKVNLGSLHVPYVELKVLAGGGAFGISK